MKIEPSAAVVSSHNLQRSISARWMEVTASTMVNELIRSTNELTEVNGISNRSAAVGPLVEGPTRFRSSR